MSKVYVNDVFETVCFGCVPPLDSATLLAFNSVLCTPSFALASDICRTTLLVENAATRAVAASRETFITGARGETAFHIAGMRRPCAATPVSMVRKGVWRR